jgi:hypothetical protein
MPSKTTIQKWTGRSQKCLQRYGSPWDSGFHLILPLRIIPSLPHLVMSILTMFQLPQHKFLKMTFRIWISSTFYRDLQLHRVVVWFLLRLKFMLQTDQRLHLCMRVGIITNNNKTYDHSDRVGEPYILQPLVAANAHLSVLSVPPMTR